MNDDINLAEDVNSEEPAVTKPVTGDMMKSENFPELRVRNVANDAITGLPDQGHFQIHGKIIHRETHTHPRTGAKTHSLRMKVHSIRHTGKHHVSAKDHRDDVESRLESAEFPSHAKHTG